MRELISLWFKDEEKQIIAVTKLVQHELAIKINLR